MDDNDIGGGLRYSKNCVSVGNSEATANWLLVAHYANWLPTEVCSGQVVGSMRRLAHGPGPAEERIDT